VRVTFILPADFFTKEILDPLQHAEAIFKEFTIDIYDEDQNHICTGLINWQIKSWKNVKTK
jgi:hypothetical protein